MTHNNQLFTSFCQENNETVSKVTKDFLRDCDVVILLSNPNAPEMTNGTTTIPEKAAKICCNPNNIFFPRGGLSPTS